MSGRIPPSILLAVALTYVALLALGRADFALDQQSELRTARTIVMWSLIVLLVISFIPRRKV